MFISISNPNIFWVESNFWFRFSGFHFIKLIPSEEIQNYRCSSVTAQNFLAFCLCHGFFSKVLYLPGRSHEKRFFFCNALFFLTLLLNGNQRWSVSWLIPIWRFVIKYKNRHIYNHKVRMWLFFHTILCEEI